MILPSDPGHPNHEAWKRDNYKMAVEGARYQARTGLARLRELDPAAAKGWLEQELSRLQDDGKQTRDPRIDGPIGELYARYDSDPRVSGPDDFEAFADAIEDALFDAGEREEGRNRVPKGKRVDRRFGQVKVVDEGEGT